MLSVVDELLKIVRKIGKNRFKNYIFPEYLCDDNSNIRGS